ncbi:zinc ABC transporter permease [Boudabousia liubingyangii]|uniref:metal ABC transporter permease n=1 Tax=Boudabousia liubingyangii TaxID=1921764 RepID=UPI00093E25E3|nr:metal ABC transporter permease [Boudabousia liubingyangii]OKL46458.1 zinc ABC transporter permease [Boudabousia liubingyangii]
MSLATGVLMLAIMASMTCALPGTFLVLKRQSMLVDGMSHAVLPGIVVGVILSGSTHSFLMAVAAALMGMLVVLGANWLKSTGLIAGDANQGLIFPFLFALGVLLLSTTLKNVHVCEDTVLTGDMNLNALPTEHLIYGNLTFGPEAFWHLVMVWVVNAVFIALTYQVLKLGIFDPALARTLGFPVKLVDWLLMFLVSLTVVVAFDTAGAILVVALVIVPPATAYLWARTLPQMLIGGQVVAVISAVLGFEIAYFLDLPTSAMMAVMDGVFFLGALGLKELVQYFRRGRALRSLTAV